MDTEEVVADLTALHKRLCRYMEDAPEAWAVLLLDVDAAICRILNPAMNGRL